MTLKVSEIFYSLQGEGSRAGEASIFIRLQGCSAKYACYNAGIRCDTDFNGGKEYSLEQILEKIKVLAPQCRWIVWTGGEPTDQLNEEAVNFFNGHRYRQAVETSGVNLFTLEVDLISISPKVAEHVLEKNFSRHAKKAPPNNPLATVELRYVIHANKELPEPLLCADHLFLSPHFDGLMMNREHVQRCIELCLANPMWSLSIQTHKLLNIL